MLNNLHEFFQGRRKSLEFCYLLYGMCNRVLLEFYYTVVCLIKAVHLVLLRLFFCTGGGGGVSKTLRNTNGGSCQMLTIDDKGGGRGVKNPKNLLT